MEKKIDRRTKYDREHTKRISFKFNLTTDADILERLSSSPNRTGYLKRLIREDMQREEKERKEAPDLSGWYEYVDAAWGFDEELRFVKPCPRNAGEIAEALNVMVRARLDSLIHSDGHGGTVYDEDLMQAYVDDLWESYWRDGIEGVPAPIFDEEE